MTIDLIDVEASGLHFDSYPVEVAVRVRGKVHGWLVRPEPTWTYWAPAAEALHGLSRERLLREGVPVSVVATELNRVLGDTQRLSESSDSCSRPIKRSVIVRLQTSS